jgi:hypothetical protein
MNCVHYQNVFKIITCENQNYLKNLCQELRKCESKLVVKVAAE